MSGEEGGEWAIRSETCCHCGKNIVGKTDVKVCSRCDFAAFCNVECLRAGYKKHQGVCNPATADMMRKNAAKPVVADNTDSERPTTANPMVDVDAKADKDEQLAPVKVATDDAKIENDGGAEVTKQQKVRLQAMYGTGKASNMKTFIGKCGEKREIAAADLEGVPVVVFQDCKDCEYVISGTCTKVFLQACHNVSVRCIEKIMTATAEVYSSTNITIDCTTAVHTVQADKTRGLVVNYADKDHLRMIVWAGCYDLVVNVEHPLKVSLRTGLDEMRREFANLREDIDQFKISYWQEKLVNERVVRTENGFPTTKRELDEFERRQEANLQKLAQSYGITIKPKPKEKTGPRVGRNDPCPCKSGKKYKNCCGK